MTRHEGRKIISRDGEQSSARAGALPCDMRRDNAIVKSRQRIVGLWRLAIHYVDAGGSNAVLPKSRGERMLVDKTPAGCIDEYGGRFHKRKRLHADKMPVIGSEGSI